VSTTSYIDLQDRPLPLIMPSHGTWICMNVVDVHVLAVDGVKHPERIIE
jgi:hypothetical protein